MDKPENIEPLPDLGRARRAPPTIDLEASEVSGDTRNVGGDAPPEPVSERVAESISTWVVSAVSGLVAASLVIGVAWVLGWPTPAPPANTAVVDDLAARVASIESKAGKPAVSAPDP